MVTGPLGRTSKKLENCIEELGVVKQGITAESSTTRDSLHIKESFRLRIRFVEMSLGEGKKRWKRMQKYRNVQVFENIENKQ